VENLRFSGGAVSAVFDRDSLSVAPEATLVGVCAHAFTTDWNAKPRGPVPTVKQARELVATYEAARGRPFERRERELASAAYAYSTAYGARCEHGFVGERADPARPYSDLVSKHGHELLAALI
jgi:hypothetical protein